MKTLLVMAVTSALLFVESPEQHRILEEHYPVTRDQRIELRGFIGSRIKIRSWDKSEVSVRLDVTFSSSNQRDEQKFLDAVSLKKQESAQALLIDYREPEISRRGDRSFWSWLNSVFTSSYTKKEAEGEIYVPKSNPVTAEIKYGLVDLEGLGGSLTFDGTGNAVTIKDCGAVGAVSNDYGNVTISQCGGDLRLGSKSTTIIVEQFQGKARIDADYSNITVRDIRQSLSIRSTSGTVKVDNVGGNADIHSDYTTLTVNTVRGMLEVENKSGSVRIRDVDGVSVEGDYSMIEIAEVSGKASKAINLNGQSGTISLTSATGNVRITNPYGPVKLKDIKGDVEIQSKSSDLLAIGVTGNWSSSTEYSQVRVRELSARRVTAVNTSSPIEISLKTPPTDVDIRNEYGTVDLNMPTGYSGEVDINVTYAQIETNLPLSRKKNFEGGGAYAIGKMGTGNGKISIETKSGNVKVMQK